VHAAMPTCMVQAQVPMCITSSRSSMNVAWPMTSSTSKLYALDVTTQNMIVVATDAMRMASPSIPIIHGTPAHRTKILPTGGNP